MIIKRKNKRSQEEMVGFALIIIIVAVIALVFLAISINKKPVERESLELSSFLASSLKYTTNCTKSEIYYYDLRELVKACFDNEKCSDGKDTCEVLRQELTGIIKEGYPVGENEANKGVKLDIYYKESEGQARNILNLDFGECKGNEIGALESIYASPGSIYVEIHKC